MPHLNAMFSVAGLDTVEAPRFHAATDTLAPAVFIELGPYGAQVSLWGSDAAAFRRVAEACTEAARLLDEAKADDTGVQAPTAET